MHRLDCHSEWRNRERKYNIHLEWNRIEQTRTQKTNGSKQSSAPSNKNSHKIMISERTRRMGSSEMFENETDRKKLKARAELVVKT